MKIIKTGLIHLDGKISGNNNTAITKIIQLFDIVEKKSLLASIEHFNEQ